MRTIINASTPRHLRAIHSASQSLLAALQREHPHIIAHLREKANHG